MASNPGTTDFPAGLDDFAELGTANSEDDAGYAHVTMHNQNIQAIEALETKVGIDDSADTDSLDYLIKSIYVNVKDFGATGDGVTDDTTAIQAAIDSLDSDQGGVVFFPVGDYITTAWNLNDLTCVTLRGAGGVGSGNYASTMVRFSDSGSDSLIDCQNGNGIHIEGMYILYTSAAFTGNVIDFRALTGTDTAQCEVKNCRIGGGGGEDGATSLIALSKSIIMRIVDCAFGKADVQILGRDDSTTDYANGIEIDHCTFGECTTAHIKNAGESWTIQNCIFQCIASDKAGAYIHDAGVKGLGVTFDGCWFGDIGSGAGGDQITWSGDGLNIVGCTLSANTGSDLVVVDENDCDGIVIDGNVLGYADVAVNFGTTTGNSEVSIQNNAFRSVTTEISGTLPSGAKTEYGGKIGIGSLPGTALVVIGGDVSLPNTNGFKGMETGGAVKNLVRMDGADDIALGDTMTGSILAKTRLEADAGPLALGAGATLTIIGTAVTVTHSYHRVDTVAGTTASSDLGTISGGTVGDILLIQSLHADRDVVVKDVPYLRIGSDFTLTNPADTITLIKTTAGWVGVSTSDNI